MNQPATYPLKPRLTSACAALVLLLGGALIVHLLPHDDGDAGWSLPDRLLPSHAQVANSPPPMARCAECHEDYVDGFAKAPHHNTLLPANDPRAVELLKNQEFVDTASDRHFQYLERDGQLWLQSSQHSTQLKVDWLFGSGHHAITPVSVMRTADGKTAALQHAVSWYPDHTIGWTLGLTTKFQNLRGIRSMAEVHTAEESRECFECHSTWIPQEQSELNFKKLIPGVHCTRCHANSSAHAADPSHQSIEKWSELTPLESVNRCGECHRRADHFTPDELTTSNKLLVRFASASIVQSQCFERQTAELRLDCTTCHDPHEPASTRPAYYNMRCLNCHQGAQRSVCSFPQTGENCVQCHMPKVAIHDNLEFTDHWIRIRETP